MDWSCRRNISGWGCWRNINGLESPYVFVKVLVTCSSRRGVIITRGRLNVGPLHGISANSIASDYRKDTLRNRSSSVRLELQELLKSPQRQRGIAREVVLGSGHSIIYINSRMIMPRHCRHRCLGMLDYSFLGLLQCHHLGML